MSVTSSAASKSCATEPPVSEGKGMPLMKAESPTAQSPPVPLCSEWSSLLPTPMRHSHPYLARRFSLAEPLSDAELATDVLAEGEDEGPRSPDVPVYVDTKRSPVAASPVAAASSSSSSSSAAAVSTSPPDTVQGPVLKGQLMKLKRSSGGKAAWNKRWFQLEGGELSYYRAEGCPTRLGWMPLDRILEIATLDPLEVIPGTNRRADCAFVVSSSSRTLHLRATSDAEKARWMHTLGQMGGADAGEGKAQCKDGESAAAKGKGAERSEKAGPLTRVDPNLGPITPDGLAGGSTKETQAKYPDCPPDQWSPELDENGDTYYFNASTGDSCWERPTAPQGK